MQEMCSKCDSLCDCPERKTQEVSVLIEHVLNNFLSTGFALRYRTLEPGEAGRMLCSVGLCSKCGGRLCHGTQLPADTPTDTLLACIYHWVYAVWYGKGCPSIGGTGDFREIFRALFHREDQPVADEWLSRPENRTVGQMHRFDVRREIYTIIETGIDVDCGYFPTPAVKGNYLSREQAREALKCLIAEKKQELDDRYDREERGDDVWEAHQEGEASTLFARIEILPSRLYTTPLQKAGDADVSQSEKTWEEPRAVLTEEAEAQRRLPPKEGL